MTSCTKRALPHFGGSLVHYFLGRRGGWPITGPPPPQRESPRLGSWSCNGYIRYMDDLRNLQDEDLRELAHAVRMEELRRHDRWQTCRRCGNRFLARRGAQYCAVRCRVAAHRQTSEEQSA